VRKRCFQRETGQAWRDLQFLEISPDGLQRLFKWHPIGWFTLLSQHLDDRELADVVRRFEEISHDIVTGLGGRVVKMIGDEVMFVVNDVADAARIGLDLADAYSDDELLSDVRVGLASGPVLLRDGDYFGPTVNLAHRIVNIGNPGTVLISDEFHTALLEEAPDEFTAQPLRPRLLKDLGRVQLWWAGRAGEVADGTGVAAAMSRTPLPGADSTYRQPAGRLCAVGPAQTGGPGCRRRR